MKHIKLYENFENSLQDIADDAQSVLVELRDDGLEISIMPATAKNSLYISITDINEDTFYFNSKIYNRLLFLNEYLNGKYSIITSMMVNDDFMVPTEFPCDIEEFSEEIMNIEIQIYLKINK